MEIETAARKVLLADATVAGYVGPKVRKFTLLDALDRTAGRAIVLKRDGQWRRRDWQRSAEYPILRVECWADHDRDGVGDMTEANAEEKALALWRAVDSRLHSREMEQWDELWIASCSLWSEPVPFVPHQYQRYDHAIEAKCYVASYAVEVIG